MRNPAERTPENQESRKLPAHAYWAHDEEDDEDEADFDDDEDDGPAPPSAGRWSSHPEFGSPQWWSR